MILKFSRKKRGSGEAHIAGVSEMYSEEKNKAIDSNDLSSSEKSQTEGKRPRTRRKKQYVREDIDFPPKFSIEDNEEGKIE